jgi:hypothetical protein
LRFDSAAYQGQVGPIVGRTNNQAYAKEMVLKSRVDDLTTDQETMRIFHGTWYRCGPRSNANGISYRRWTSFDGE